MQHLIEMLFQNAKNYKDRCAFSDSGEKLSFEEVFTRSSSLAATISSKGHVVGVLAESGNSWALAQLAAVLAGKLLVPIPTFFSSDQIASLTRDAGIELMLVTQIQAGRLGVCDIERLIIGNYGATSAQWGVKPGFGQIVYTSGSTGAPKGVRHEGGQIAWSARALAAATNASASDLHLSVLPLPMLLETICAIFVPTLVGARAHFETAFSERLAQGDVHGIGNIFEERRPTTSVLVPHLLRRWTGELSALGRPAPSSLRVVAVGGAAIGEASAQAAVDVGIPVFEGYGLSECCSVVSLNTPAERKSGTVGRALPGLDVTIDGGEIVVDGPSVMSGYLHKGRQTGPWRTGDLGHLDIDGYLTVLGRKDNLIVTSTGRNVSPEWVEGVLAADPRILGSCVLGCGGPFPSALIVPSCHGSEWFGSANDEELRDSVRTICAALPDYAIPQEIRVLDEASARAQGLFTSNGRIKRDIARSLTTQTQGA